MFDIFDFNLYNKNIVVMVIFRYIYHKVSNMKKYLTTIGESLGFIIDKPIAELYQINQNTQIEVTPKEDGLNIRFLKENPSQARDDEVMKAAEDINKRYNTMMGNLAK